MVDQLGAKVAISGERPGFAVTARFGLEARRPNLARALRSVVDVLRQSGPGAALMAELRHRMRHNTFARQAVLFEHWDCRLRNAFQQSWYFPVSTGPHRLHHLKR
jgi:hypothetical protein